VPFLIGADYYPEHWPEGRWPVDAELMGKAGFNVVRMAEFAWSKIEPKEGDYRFEWLDKIIDLLSKKGVQAIIGTPTASPPPWIVKVHSDILRIDGFGKRAPEGTRRNYCGNNPNYIEHSERTVTEMVRHYQDNPNVIGWQIDNEFGCHASEMCYCKNCVEAFRTWLKAKHKTLENLNNALGLIFWGQEYGDWDEVMPPRQPFTMQNPGLVLEWQRFSSDVWVRYQQCQVDIIRKHAPHQLVTHNFMGLYKDLDYFKLAEPLDVVSFDYYPKWAEKVDYALQAMAHDVMRSLKKKPYWIMELQSGAVQTQMAPTPRPGEIRLWTIQSAARGADGIIYFRWRTCKFGAEEYWHGILDHDAVPRRRYAEVQKVSQELRKVASHIEGTVVEPEVAVALVYENIWAFDHEVGYGDKNYYGMNSWRPTQGFYRAFYARNIPVDFVNPISEELSTSRYKAVVLPSLTLMNQEIEGKLRSYVKEGGTLVASPRTGAKNWNNNICDGSLPGRLSDIFGTTVEEYTGLPSETTVEIKTALGGVRSRTIHTCVNWAEMLSPTKAKVIAYYTTGIFRSKPAVTVNTFGDGAAVYIGVFGDNRFYLAFLDWLAKNGKIGSILPSAEGFEATKRTSNDHEVFFALNYNDDALQIPLDQRVYKDLVKGKKIKHSLRINGLDARILEAVE